MRAILTIFLSLPLLAFATVEEPRNQKPLEELPLFEYGWGLGYTHFQHYPAADQSRGIGLPFGTFQYRGRRLRADDREGAQAKLFRTENWFLDLDGGVMAELNSNDNDARRGMDNIPWSIRLGPELRRSLLPDLEFRMSVEQTVLTDFRDTRWGGVTGEARLIWQTFTQITFGILTGDSVFQSTYFSVPREFATATRPEYGAKGGFLSSQISFFQKWPDGKWAYYLGGSAYNYSNSANRASPLHRSDVNVNMFMGITYTIGESVERARSEPEEPRTYPLEKLSK